MRALRNTGLIVPGIVAMQLIGASLFADFFAIPNPSALYIQSTALIDFAAGGSTVSGTSDGTLTISYDTGLEQGGVPAVWRTWNTPPAVETATPNVGMTGFITSLTSSFSLPVYVLGFEAEPDFLGVDEITASFYHGAALVGTIGQNVDGSGGARLFAAATETSPFTSVTVNDVSGDDFAIARQRYSLVPAQFSSTPEPGGLLLLASGLLVLSITRPAFRPRPTLQAKERRSPR